MLSSSRVPTRHSGPYLEMLKIGLSLRRRLPTTIRYSVDFLKLRPNLMLHKPLLLKKVPGMGKPVILILREGNETTGLNHRKQGYSKFKDVEVKQTYCAGKPQIHKCQAALELLHSSSLGTLPPVTKTKHSVTFGVALIIRLKSSCQPPLLSSHIILVSGPHSSQ